MAFNPSFSKFVSTPRESHDERGRFAKLYQRNSVLENSENIIEQVNLVQNSEHGTLRGLHWQLPPYDEKKIVTCLKGEIWDVIVDIREYSDTYCDWYGAYLNPSNRLQVRVPRGFAHGYITTKEQSGVLYFSDNVYSQVHEMGAKWNDSRFNIVWPLTPLLISKKDEEWPKFS